MKMTDYIKAFVPALILVFAGCQDDDISVTTDTENDNRRIEFAAPAGEITYKMADLLDDIDNEHIYIDEDGLIYASYLQEVDIPWETLVSLPDISETWSYSPTGSSGSPELKASGVFKFTEKIRLNHRNDVRYDSLNMVAGNLSAEISLPPGTIGQITVTIPEVEENGSPLQYFFDADVNNYMFSINENLAEKEVEFSQAADSSYISVVTILDLSTIAVGSAELNFSLTDMVPGMAFGYFGQQQSSKLNEQLTFDVFDELDMIDEVEFFDISIELDVTNEIGTPFSVRTDNMRFYTSGGTLIDVLRVDGNEYIDLSLDAATYGDPVEPTELHFDISKENSDNIVDIGNSYPSEMIFDVISMSNPDGNTEQLNFMGPENNLIGKLKILLPAWFKTSMYSRQDTIDFNFVDMMGDSEDDARELEEFNVYFDFYSRMPLEISATAWVIDANGNKIDDLLDGRVDIIKSGQPDETGFVQDAEHTEFKVTVSGDQINRFLDEKASNIIMSMEIGTLDNDYVKIYESMDFRAVVSFDAAGKIPAF